MKSISKDTIAYRTRLMEEAHATRFARCLMANARFRSVSVEESQTARSACRFFVRYQPSSEERQRDLIRGEGIARQQRAEEQAGEYLFVLDDSGRFFHCLSYESGEVYETTQHTCTCADFHYRGPAVGACKHMRILSSGKADVRSWAQAAAPVQAAPAFTPEQRAAQAEADRRALWD